MRSAAVCLAALLAAAVSAPAASAKELKPKFGDIGGVYYTDVAENREACRQAIKNKIALCRQNTSFVSNTLDRKYPGCLPIFRDQSRGCADHFRSEAYKCQGSGPVRIGDFTGFACTVTATVVEEGGEPESGEPESGTGSRDPAPKGRGSAAHLSPKCAGMGKGAKCWLELANRPGCYLFDFHYLPGEASTWSGACSGGAAAGRGTQVRTFRGKSSEFTGAMVRGKRHGRWIMRYASGSVDEGRYADGTRHGRWVNRDGGIIQERSYVDGKAHGRWVFRKTSGGCLYYRYDRGRKIGGPSRC